jgi:hypothetical protein
MFARSTRKMRAGWHQKKLMLKERMRLKIRERLTKYMSLAKASLSQLEMNRWHTSYA